MRTPQYIAIAIALLLIPALYFFGNTIPPKPAATAAGKDAPHNNAAAAGAMGPQSMVTPAHTDSIINAEQGKLTGQSAQSMAALTAQLKSTADSASMAVLYDSASKIYEREKQYEAFAWHLGKSGHLAHSEKKLNFAGQIFLDLMHRDKNPSVQVWDAQQAIALLSESLQLNPNDDTITMALASGYIEGTGEVMTGVGLLKGITQKDPDNIPANLMLARMDIQSGQFPKAIPRLEGILAKEPENREALYLEAEAYKGKGDKAKAIALFEQCKKIVNDPDFSREIDEYINSFK